MSRLAPRLEKFAAAFAAAARFPKNPPLPVTTPAPDFCRAQIANYAHPRALKKTGDNAGPMPHLNPAHFPTSEEKQTAINIIRWGYAVADLRADSPRFAYYVSRWDVPGKVARAIADGTFNDLTAHCPPIDPAWARLVPAALEAHRLFTAAHRMTPGERTQYLPKTAQSE